MSLARCILAVVLAAAAGAATSQQVYRWVDEKGRVQVTDTPPPRGARQVQKPRAPDAPPAAPEPFALTQARKNAPVTLYSTPGCDPCNQARSLLNARGIPFKEVSVVDDKQIEELKKAVGANSVPSLIVGSRVQQGYEETTYHGILDAAGYPKAGALPPRNQQEPKAPPETAEGAAPDKPEAPAPRGPYSPSAGPLGDPRPGPYTPRTGPLGEPRPGPYSPGPGTPAPPPQQK